MADIGARLAKHDGGLRFVKPQQVENRMFAVTCRHRQRAIFDVDMLPRLALRLDSQGIALEILGQCSNLFRHRRRKHQRAAFGRGGAQNELQILAEPQIQHLVGFVQNHGANARHIQRRPLDMVTQTARRAHNDMRAPVQCPLFRAVIHTANAGRNLGIGSLIEPVQLSRHLQRQLARWCNHQGHRAVGIQQLVRALQQFIRNGDAKGHRLARPGLRGHQQVAPGHFGAQHGVLHGGHGLVSLGCERRSQRGRDLNIGHVVS